MMGYDYVVSYKKGIDNVVADVLSRKPLMENSKLMAITSVTTGVIKRVAETWFKDEKLKKIIAALERGSTHHSKYSCDGRLLKRKGKSVVEEDPELKTELISYFHGSAIGGSFRGRGNYQKVGRYF
ncbi:hypothetical protein HRI_000717100 [Hibiscus trionum]|uniref:Uncharacterized protein n=1 Tax=Hibiscus trionum TaxID=183268 RepID=A0A9W7H4W4_HIBTR|nr:hypothetical protein HRI_000717100 [Hibiscus trionum]